MYSRPLSGSQAPGAPSARELALLALGASLLAVLMTWPLALRLHRVLPDNLLDPPLQAWIVAWGGHALRHEPLRYFDSNAFWPLENSLSLAGDPLIGYAPLALIGSGVAATIVHYNLLYLSSYALAFAGAYLLARELGAHPAGAAVAGAAFAYAPWRAAHAGHLHVLSSGGIPLSLFLLLHAYRRRSPWSAAAGFLVAAWQLSLGLNLGLQLAYLVLAFAAGGLVWRLRSRRPLLERRLVPVTALGVASLVAALAVVSFVYGQVRAEHPRTSPEIFEIASLSPLPQSFLAAPEGNRLWGEATADVRETLRSTSEQTLFPGVAILLLAATGLAAPVYTRRVRLALAGAALLAGVLSLGIHPGGGRIGAFLPYRLLYELAPGWQAIRTPGRINTLTSLALALLAAAGAQWLVARLRRDPSLRGRLSAAAATVAVVAVVLLEGSAAVPNHQVPEPSRALSALGGPRLHLPMGGDSEALYMVWSTDGFPALVNGRGRDRRRLREPLSGFPDRRSVEMLQNLRVRVVVFHPELAQGTPWAGAERRRVGGLPLERRRVGELVVYRLRS